MENKCRGEEGKMRFEVKKEGKMRKFQEQAGGR
jgi:hypothetical protein